MSLDEKLGPNGLGRVVAFRNCWNMAPLVAGFERLGYEVWENPSDADMQKLQPGELLLCVTNVHIDIKKPWRALAMKSRVNELQAPYVFWDRDGPSHMGEKAWRIWLLKHFAFMDAYATHTLQDAGKFSDEVIYLPNAVWEERYNLAGSSLEALRNPVAYEFDVSFFGRIDPKRYPETEFRAAFVEKLRPVLDSLGISYFFGDHDLQLAEQIRLIQRSKINLSFFAGCDVRYQGGYHGEPFSWGLPERCYGIPACGGFLLSDERAHARDDFVLGSEWVEFGNFDQCVEKIRLHLADFEMTRDVAEAAHRRVMTQHRYLHRAEKLVQFVKYWKQKRRYIKVEIGL